MKKRVVPSSRAQVYAEISKSELSLSSDVLTSLIPNTPLILHSNPYPSSSLQRQPRALTIAPPSLLHPTTSCLPMLNSPSPSTPSRTPSSSQCSKILLPLLKSSPRGRMGQCALGAPLEMSSSPPLEAVCAE